MQNPHLRHSMKKRILIWSNSIKI